MKKVRIKKLDSRAVAPQYATEGSSGFDLVCLNDTSLPADTWRIIQTGLSFAIPEGFEMQIRSRSGSAVEHGLIVLNQPGTIDSDYRGPVGIVVWNITNVSVTVEAGTRIAQGIICPIERVEFEIVEELETTERGEGGFGSTGYINF